MNTVISLGSFGVLAVLWLGFGAALVWNQSVLDSAWQALRSLPWALQGLVWLLGLPVALGLWIWETDWPVWVRLILVVGLGVATLYTFYPKHT